MPRRGGGHWAHAWARPGLPPPSPAPLHRWPVLRLGPPAAGVWAPGGVARSGSPLVGGVLFFAVEPALLLLCLRVLHCLTLICPIVLLVWLVGVRRMLCRRWWMLCHHCLVALTDASPSSHRWMLCRRWWMLCHHYHVALTDASPSSLWRML